MLRQLPDIFCWLYDGLDLEAFRASIADWELDPHCVSIATDIEADAVAGRLTREAVQIRLDNCGPGGPDRLRYACLLGLDRALGHLNPAQAPGVPAPLAGLGFDAEVACRLDSGLHGGALLTRPIGLWADIDHEEEEEPIPDHPRSCFRSVTRVPERHWSRCEVIALPEGAMLHRSDLRAGVLVACCPLIADPEEMSFRRLTRGTRSYYRIKPKDERVTRKRIAEVLAKVDASEARIAVVPELTLSPALRAVWSEALRDPGRGSTRLLWLLAGTGDVDGGRRPVNAAVILDGRTGEELVRQGKNHRFNLKPEDLRRWNLVDRLGDQLIHEDIEPTTNVKVIEAGGLRIVILICEDAARVEEFGELLADLAPTHVLVPVFSRPVHARRWERAAADVYKRCVRSAMLVLNSKIMANVLESAATGPPGTRGVGLGIWPGGDVLFDLDDPADIQVLRLHGDGAIERVSS